MSTFIYIVKTIMNTHNNFFSPKYIKNDKIDPICKMLFESFIINNNKNIVSCKNKFIFYENFINNLFLKNKYKLFIEYFNKIQKTYNALNRFAFICKFKKTNIMVKTDLCLNPININDKNILCIYHVNAKYLFYINDLIKIINNSLTSSHNFFSEPLSIKNPYNNISFTKSNLYNIYFFIKFNTNIYDDLFFKFFHCNFNLSLFYKKYEYLLRDYSIKNFIKNLSDSAFIGEINKMLDRYNYKNKNNKIIINCEFPKKKLIHIMKPYLLLSLQSIYSLIPIIKIKSGIELNNKLNQFQTFNPQFGRKLIKLDFKVDSNFKKKAFIKCYEFNDKHIAFYNHNYNINFLKNQLSFNEANINENDIEESDYEESDNEDGQILNNPYDLLVYPFRIIVN